MKKTVAILFGGCSSEYKISLQSAYCIIKAIDTEKYNPLLIGITNAGTWFLYNSDLEKIKENTWMNEKNCLPAMISSNKGDHGILVFNNNSIDKIWVDMAFPVLHGKNGEDGTVQGLCQLAGIPIVGCQTLSSALCMNKYMAHLVANASGIDTPASYTISNISDDTLALKYAEKLKYPLFVKPVKAGSSYGITKVNNKNELIPAIKAAFEYDDQVILEENIEGFEVGCAVLGNDELTIGRVDEIELVDGFFDYAEKYDRKTAKIHMPARITDTKADEIKSIAATIYKALGCQGFARVDMFLTPDDKIVFNEVNTIPGFTTCSRYPNMLKGIGITFEKIIDMLLELAV